MARPLSNGPGVLRQALVASVAAHLALALLGAQPLGGAAGRGDAAEAPAAPAEPDRWAGVTASPGDGLFPVEVDGPGPAAPAGEAAAAPAAAEPPAPAPLPTARPTAAPIATAKPAVTARPEDEEGPAPAPSAQASAPDPDGGADPYARGRDIAPVKTQRDRRAAAASAGGAGSPPSGPGAGAFGEEGTAGVRDLGRAFTRAIPVSAGADPAWAKLAPGPAGSIELAIEVDATGKIVRWAPAGKDKDKDAPKHLVQLVRRTIALLDSGTFALKGAVGSGAQVLALSARVSDVEVPADHPGGAFNLSWSFDGTRGKAAFTQVGGRRVELDLRVVRIDR